MTVNDHRMNYSPVELKRQYIHVRTNLLLNLSNATESAVGTNG